MCVCVSVPFYLFNVNPNFLNKKVEGIEGSFKHTETTAQFSILEKEFFVKSCGKV